MNYLAMIFKGPMQSWGCNSYLDHRITMTFPTKSGVFGIICAALGDNSDEILSKLNELTMEILIFESKYKAHFIIDFNTVHDVPIVDKNGKRDAILNKEFLVDSCFGVILSGNDDLVDKCYCALINPKWGVWLGRKCCIATVPICQGRFCDRDEAFKHLSSFGDVKRVVIDSSFEESDNFIRDVPISFKFREFGFRYTSG